MFGLILFIFVLSFVVRLISRPLYGYYRPWFFPYGGFGSWGMGMGHRHCPMHHRGPHHHHHFGHGRRW